MLITDQAGTACRTNRRSCVYRAVRDSKLVTIAEPVAQTSFKRPW